MSERTDSMHDTDTYIDQVHGDVLYDIGNNTGSLEGNTINIPPKWQAFQQMGSDQIYIMLDESDLLSSLMREYGEKIPYHFCSTHTKIDHFNL